MDIRQLILYIKNLSNQGYDYNTIRSYLQNQGYEVNTVNRAISISYYYDPNLDRYITAQVSRGIDPGRIKQALLQNGYNSAVIDSSLALIPQRVEVNHTVHLSGRTFMFISIILIALIGSVAGMMYFLNNPDKTELLDFSIDIHKTIYYPGDEVSFTAELTSMGSTSRYDIQLIFQIIDENGLSILSKKEEVAIETRVSPSVGIKLPSDIKTGTYQVSGVAKYGNKLVAEALSQEFSIKSNYLEPEKPEEPIEPEKPIINQTEDDNKTSNDNENNKPTEPVKPSEPIELPDTGKYDDLNNNEIIKIIEQESSNPDRAGEICKSLTDETKRDFCLFELAKMVNLTSVCDDIQNDFTKDNCIERIAKIKNDVDACSMITKATLKDNCYKQISTNLKDSSICANIADEFNRNSCYMTAALKDKDFDACDKITHSLLKDSCEQLKDVNDQSS